MFWLTIKGLMLSIKKQVLCSGMLKRMPLISKGKQKILTGIISIVTCFFSKKEVSAIIYEKKVIK